MTTVAMPKDELFEMLDIANEMVTFCSVHMPKERYLAVANSVWVLAHRAAGDDVLADNLKRSLAESRVEWHRIRV